MAPCKRPALGLTSFGQQYLPGWVNSLSNSAGGWTIFAFLIIWLSRARPVLGGILGIVVFQLLNESYGVVSGWSGYEYGAPFTSTWTLVGLVTGPLVGATGSLARYGTPLLRALSVTPLSAVLLGESVWALDTIVDTTSPIYWTIEAALSLVFVSVATARRPLTLTQRIIW